MDNSAFIYRTHDASAAPKEARRARMDFETVKDMEKLLVLLPKAQKNVPEELVEKQLISHWTPERGFFFLLRHNCGAVCH